MTRITLTSLALEPHGIAPSDVQEGAHVRMAMFEGCDTFEYVVTKVGDDFICMEPA